MYGDQEIAARFNDAFQQQIEKYSIPFEDHLANEIGDLIDTGAARRRAAGAAPEQSSAGPSPRRRPFPAKRRPGALSVCAAELAEEKG